MCSDRSCFRCGRDTENPRGWVKQERTLWEPRVAQRSVPDVKLLELENKVRRLEDENRFLKGSSSLLRERTMVEACRLVFAEKANQDVAMMWDLLGTFESGFYAWGKRVPSATLLWRAGLLLGVEQIFTESSST